MKEAAVGFRVHSGWAAVVAISVDKGVPSALARERIRLVETFTYEFRQPYHTAKKMPLEKGRDLIGRMQNEAREFAYSAIRGLQVELQEKG